jgi:hypothetical protein
MHHWLAVFKYHPSLWLGADAGYAGGESQRHIEALISRTVMHDAMKVSPEVRGGSSTSQYTFSLLHSVVAWKAAVKENMSTCRQTPTGQALLQLRSLITARLLA